ncbi:hypothetical protein [Enterococcus olivae]
MEPNILSIKYALVSFVVLFFATMVIIGFSSDFSTALEQSRSEQFLLLGETAWKILRFSLPPLIIIGAVFYFYIFPSQSRA